MNRREFVGTSLIAGAGITAVSGNVNSARAGEELGKPGDAFKLAYAPHFGMFRHHGGNNEGQLKFAADEGFRAWEDNGMMGRGAKAQDKLGKLMEQLKIRMGVFVAYAEFNKETFVRSDKGVRDMLRKRMKEAVECAKRVNAKWTTVVPGAFSKRVEWDYQTANVIENLKVCCEVLEPAGLTMVLEPLNPYADHPGCFLSKVPQAYLLCKGVNSPSCKILDDLYHQQITEGHLIKNMEYAWDEIPYLQVGDNPGRQEPLTGEINYRNVFKWLHGRKFTGIIGMEHGNSVGGKVGERKVIDAYRWCDGF